ncbi:MAG: ABC transporter permease subunit [Neisseriaceae bacterium]|nr:MAG: ABC transporter permease subunit [Neisseriaceae bacterium]
MQEKNVFNHKILPYLLIIPQLIIVLVFFFLPAGQSIWSSFFVTDNFGRNPSFVGLANYAALFLDEAYYQSIVVTVVFSTLVTLIGLGIALLLALMADNVLKGKLFYRTFLIIPYAIAPAVVGALMNFIFSPSVGILAFMLRDYFGIPWNPLLNSTHALALATISAVWIQVSYNFLFFLAGLQSIPQSVIEASAIDGAGPWRRFKDIIIPLLAPTTFFLFIMNIIYAFFETFPIIDMTTQGGPGNMTNILVYRVYKVAFQENNYGSSGAQSVILMLIIITLTFIQFKYIEKKIHY